MQLVGARTVERFIVFIQENQAVVGTFAYCGVAIAGVTPPAL